jgi:hypothetical protein
MDGLMQHSAHNRAAKDLCAWAVTAKHCSDMKPLVTLQCINRIIEGQQKVHEMALQMAPTVSFCPWRIRGVSIPLERCLATLS